MLLLTGRVTGLAVRPFVFPCRVVQAHNSKTKGRRNTKICVNVRQKGQKRKVSVIPGHEKPPGSNIVPMLIRLADRVLAGRPLRRIGRLQRSLLSACALGARHPRRRISSTCCVEFPRRRSRRLTSHATVAFNVRS